MKFARTMATAVLLTGVLAVTAHGEDTGMEGDPYLWLEDVESVKARKWVEEQNRRTADVLGQREGFDALYEDALETLNSDARIPVVVMRSGYLYNFWQDASHPRGVYRRTTLESFRSDEPDWETVLDIDALSAAEGKQWVFGGIDCLRPENRHCLIGLSEGGSDAREIREFDMQTLSFVDDGFRLPAAKSNVTWVDENELLVGTDFGPGTLTDSGYPRQVKRWRRGTSLDDAETLFSGDESSVSVSSRVLQDQLSSAWVITESSTFWKRRYYLLLGGATRALQLPDTATLSGSYQGCLVFRIHEDWQYGEVSFMAGAVLTASVDTLLEGRGDIQLLIAPDASRVIEDVDVNPHGVLVTTLDNVRARLFLYRESVTEGRAHIEETPVALPDNGSIRVVSMDGDTGDFLALFESFTRPATLYLTRSASLDPVAIKSQTAAFDGSRFEVEQLWTTSADGTRIPYFLVMNENAIHDGKNPVHIFAYGGFRHSLTPSYSGSYEQLSGAYGKLWLERGGAFVLANIRGGGEFGPEWHASVLKENRYKVFEDLEAVARDLIARKVTSAERIGIEGRSNGGLLVMTSAIREPALYGAVVCGSPLLDMRRYNELLAGQSWVAEYGNPDDPSEWAFMKAWSPYQMAEEDAEYPAVFFYASTRDDRVHPGHARKMVARMSAQGHEVYFFENTEGGHNASSTNEQLAYRLALAYAHLWHELTGTIPARRD